MGGLFIQTLLAQTYTDLMTSTLTGDAALRWCDKSYSEVWHRNGTMSMYCAHSAMDAMVMVLFLEQSIFLLTECNGMWTGSQSVGRHSCFDVHFVYSTTNDKFCDISVYHGAHHALTT